MYTKQDLAQLGKQASDQLIQHGVPLNEAIVKIASSRPDMGKEHVQRVIENANLITFEQMFKGASSKHITFDLADPNEIHAMLDKSEESADPIYSTSPEYRSTSNFFDMIQKEASVAEVPEHVRWRREYHATKTAAAQLEQQLVAADAQAEALTHNFVQMCKRASLDGAGVKPLLQLAGYASHDKEVFAKVAHAVSTALPNAAQGEYVDDLPNRDHPVYKEYAKLEGAIKEAQLLRKGLINAQRMHESVLSEEYVK